MFESVKKFLGFETEKLKYPASFALIKFTDIAKEKGTFDDFNKEIVIYENGVIKEIVPFSEQEVKAIREVYKIPVEEEKIDDSEFKFDTIATFGVVVNRR